MECKLFNLPNKITITTLQLKFIERFIRMVTHGLKKKRKSLTERTSLTIHDFQPTKQYT